uniref:Uncharacterized protein n=1 Tax=Romanomermis culicivorax TaxID=13658 RepID=A0A915J8V1_ROMCU
MFQKSSPPVVQIWTEQTIFLKISKRKICTLHQKKEDLNTQLHLKIVSKFEGHQESGSFHGQLLKFLKYSSKNFCLSPFKKKFQRLYSTGIERPSRKGLNLTCTQSGLFCIDSRCGGSCSITTRGGVVSVQSMAPSVDAPATPPNVGMFFSFAHICNSEQCLIFDDNFSSFNLYGKPVERCCIFLLYKDDVDDED